jgi:acyl transferase domain-containing protein
MAAIAATEEEVRESLPSDVDIAAVNGPRSVVISGPEAAVQAAMAVFSEAGRRTKQLVVSHAFHSTLMEPMLAEFREVAARLIYSAPAVPVVSNVTGRIATAEQLCSPEYWVGHVREAVRFADGVATLLTAGVTRFVELGPDAVLTGMARECGPAGPRRRRSGTAPGPRRGGDAVHRAHHAVLARREDRLAGRLRGPRSVHCGPADLRVPEQVLLARRHQTGR